MENKALILVLTISMALSLFFVTPVAALAGEGGGNNDENAAGAELDSALDEVLDFLRGLTQSIIGFFVFIGGIAFTVGFVLSATRGAIHQTLGNQIGLSRAVLSAITVLGAFLFLIASFQIAKSISVTLTDRFIDPSNFEIADASKLGGGKGGNDTVVSPEEILQSQEIQGIIRDLAAALIRFLIGVIILVFFIGIVRGAFDTQLGALIGGEQIVSAGILRAVGAIMTLVVGIVAFPLSQSLINSIVPRLLGDLTIPMP
jgi:hypothetical protein